MFYQLRFFTLFLGFFMLSATCSEAFLVQNRTFYSLFVTCELLDINHHFIKKPKWQEIKHNSTRNISHCPYSLKITRSRQTTRIVSPGRAISFCTESVNLHKHMLAVPSDYKPGYTLNGSPISMYVCWNDSTVHKKRR